MRVRSLCRHLLVLLPFLSAPALAQNLVVNSGFDGTTAGWAAYGNVTDGSTVHSSDDLIGNALSGSAEVTLLSTAAGGTVTGLSQCIAVTAGQTYDYHARIKFPTGQTAGESRAVMELAFFSDGACGTALDLADGQGAVVGTAYSLSDSVWPGIPGNAGPGTEAAVLAPVGAASAQVRIYLERIAAGAGSEVTRFDQVVVHDSTTTPVSLTTFEAE